MAMPAIKPAYKELAHLFLTLEVTDIRTEVKKARQLCSTVEEMEEVMNRLLDRLEGRMDDVLQ